MCLFSATFQSGHIPAPSPQVIQGVRRESTSMFLLSYYAIGVALVLELSSLLQCIQPQFDIDPTFLLIDVVLYYTYWLHLTVMLE